MDAPPSVLLTGNAARRRTHVQWVLENFALATWVSRHLTGDEALSLALRRLSFGPGINGIEEAAKKFAGKHPDQMDAEEVASARRQRVSSPHALSAERACSSSLIAWFNSGDRCMYLIVVLRLEAEGSLCHRSSSAPSRARRCERKGSQLRTVPPCASGIRKGDQPAECVSQALSAAHRRRRHPCRGDLGPILCVPLHCGARAVSRRRRSPPPRQSDTRRPPCSGTQRV